MPGLISVIRCRYCALLLGAGVTGGAGFAGAGVVVGELMTVVGMANETNRLANGYRVPIDPAFE